MLSGGAVSVALAIARVAAVASLMQAGLVVGGVYPPFPLASSRHVLLLRAATAVIVMFGPRRAGAGCLAVRPLQEARDPGAVSFASGKPVARTRGSRRAASSGGVGTETGGIQSRYSDMLQSRYSESNPGCQSVQT